MRKNILSLSIAAMVGGIGIANAAVFPAAGVLIPATQTAATVLEVAPGGIGHQLVLPYFTVQGGNATVISLVNTDTKNGKAVKVRFRSGANSDDILDFQVYMSPSDVWNGLVSKNASTGIAQFQTSDATCTVPAFTPGSPQAFITGRLPSYSTATDLANLTSEGYVEIFNMADIPATADTTSAGLYNSIKHTAGVPKNCAAASVVSASTVDATDEANAVAKGFLAPTTGLMGNWTIINVAQTTTFSGEMTAIKALVAAAGADGTGAYVVFPQTDGDASTGTTAVDSATADPLFRTANVFPSITTAGVFTATNAIAGPTVAAAFYDLPDMSTPYTVAAAPVATDPLGQATALTSALAVTSITNEYATDASVTAATDWTFSMPTRRYSVAVKYGTSAGAASRLFAPVPSALDAASQFFNVTNATLSGDRLCVSAKDQKFFDREEKGQSTGAVFSPGSVATFRFCGETSVTSFGSAPVSVLGATLATQTTGNSAFANGWGVINTPNASPTPTNIGLPIRGSSFIKLNNPSASAGTSGTYGITSAHRYTAAR